MRHGRRNRVLSLAVLALGLYGVVPGLAAVTSGGDTTVAATASADTIVGNTGIGTLGIDGGSTVTDESGCLGLYRGSEGTATVSGVGSLWTNSFGLIVGSTGSGTLRIESGGQVSSSEGYVGSDNYYGQSDFPAYNTHSSGTATVSGVGSLWTNSNDLYVGESGSGTLRIEAGGQVSNRDGYLGCGYGYDSGFHFIYDVHSSGTATVSGVGSTWTNSKGLYVGWSGSGTLIVEAEAQVSAGALTYLGYHAGSSGSLSVEAGGQVTSSWSILGYHPGSSGTATVSGVGSLWTSENLYVGYNGSGSLTVADGGVVTTRTIYASLSDLHGNSTITANGAVLDTDLVFDRTHGLTQTLAFGSDGRLNLMIDGTAHLGAGHKGSGSLRILDGVAVASTAGELGYRPGSSGTATVSGAGSQWTISGSYGSSGLYVGWSGSGTLNVEAGGQVTSSWSILGYDPGSSGTATVCGTGSIWTSEYLCVGDNGSGSLTVADGGLVTTQTLAASFSDLHGNGTITAHGAVLDADLIFDRTHGLTQTLAFGSGGTLNLMIDGTGDLGIGYRGCGSLRILDGVTVTSATGRLGRYSGGTGRATVSGAGSTWISDNLTIVDGALTIEAGGQVSNGTDGCIGIEGSTKFGSAMATVSGMGSRWTSGMSICVGLGNTLTVADGGNVTAKWMYVGDQADVRLHVSGDDMLVLGDETAAGYIINNGTVSLYADAFLPAGTYHPICGYAAQAMNWLEERGSYQAFGGMWDSAAETFTVAEPTALAAMASDIVTTGGRLQFTDGATGRRVGASFGTVTGSVSFSAASMGDDDLGLLAGLLEEGDGVLSAWSFTTNYSGGEVMLSFDVGMDAEGLAIWHLQDGVWSACTPSLLTYDANGIASFTVNSFSGYAVTAAVPEPGTMGLMALAGSMLLIRRRTRAVPTHR